MAAATQAACSGAFTRLRPYVMDGKGLVPPNVGDLGASGSFYGSVNATRILAAGDGVLPRPQSIWTLDPGDQPQSHLSDRGINQAMVYWGLVLYHDVVDTEPLADLCTGACGEEQLAAAVQSVKNGATSFHDLDSIYGRDANDTSLRTGVGGAMRLSDTGLPLWNVTTRQFLVADQRNAQLPGTFALTALLLREHNRRAANLTAAPPPWLNSTHAQYVDHLWEQGCDDSACRGATEKDHQCKHCDVVYDPEGPCGLGQAWSADEKLYQMARAWTISAAQHITLNQYIPTLLGLPSSAPALSGFDAALDPPEDPTIDLLAAVAMGWPHTALSPVDRVLSAAWGSMPSVDLLQVGSVCGGAALRQLSSDIGGGIDPLLRGMMLADAGAVDLRLPPGLSAGDCGIAPLSADVRASDEVGAVLMHHQHGCIGAHSLPA
eukprot:TRINITY_DN31168_c0_g1_i1.p1 TRINITY_DN31168_c0_g1~~TRINITY_DN31168_c0_g1_i1.p1  ORF type:complete len:434 (-),score=102.81 TRINITY_DN31168_c0_g1_i1:17-1318(-)